MIFGAANRGNRRANALRAVFYPSSSLWSGLFTTMFQPVVAVRVYIVTFRRHKDRRPSKFIVVADSMRQAVDMAWEHGGADFQAMFDRTTGQALEMKKGVLRVL
jgi:hypothetical protein